MPRNVERFETLFLRDDNFEDWHLNEVHKAVLGLNHLDLTTAIQWFSRGEINQCDKYGRTALFWATCRNDVPALSLLLSHGADVNVKGTHARSALMMAIQRQSEPCARLLLDARIDVTRPDHWGWYVLHHCCYVGCEIDILETVLLRGVDVNAKTGNNGFTSLSLAVDRGYFQICELLLSRNADLNAADDFGTTPLHVAILESQREILHLLLKHKADQLLKTHAGESILHYAAQYGSIECFQVLRCFRLNGFDLEDKVLRSSPRHRSNKIIGLTALEIAEQRTDVTPEWLEEFRKLIHTVEAANSPNSKDHSREAGIGEVEEFEDALEHQVMS